MVSLKEGLPGSSGGVLRSRAGVLQLRGFGGSGCVLSMDKLVAAAALIRGPPDYVVR